MKQSKQGFRALELYNTLVGEGLDEKNIINLGNDLIAIVKDVGTEND